MKSLVVYDSQFGNTQKIAEKISQTLGTKATRASEFKKEMLNGIDLLIVGSPIQAWRPTMAVSSFLSAFSTNSLKNINIAAFDTRLKIFFSGDAAKQIDKQLVDLGGKSVASPQGFIVSGKNGFLKEGELERASVWAKQILIQMKIVE